MGGVSVPWTSRTGRSVRGVICLVWVMLRTWHRREDLARSLGRVEDMNPELERQAWQETRVKGSPAGIYCTLVMCQALC